MSSLDQTVDGERERGGVHATDAHASAGEGTEGRLGTRARGLRADTAGGADLDVESGDADLLAALGDVLGRKHLRGSTRAMGSKAAVGRRNEGGGAAGAEAFEGGCR